MQKLETSESESAAKILGVSLRENLNFKDGFFLNDKSHQLKVIECIRKYKPEIVLCNAQDDRHIDHPKGASLVSDSCFLSGLKKVKTKFDNNEQPLGDQSLYTITFNGKIPLLIF